MNKKSNDNYHEKQKPPQFPEEVLNYLVLV